MRNRTSDLRIPRSDALQLSHRDSTVSEGSHGLIQKPQEGIMILSRLRAGKIWNVPFQCF